MVYNTSDKTVKKEAITKVSLGVVIVILSIVDAILTFKIMSEWLIRLSVLSTSIVVFALVVDWLLIYASTYKKLSPMKNEMEKWQKIIEMRKRCILHDKVFFIILAVSIMTSFTFFIMYNVEINWITHEFLIWIIACSAISRDMSKMKNQIVDETMHCDLLNRIL